MIARSMMQVLADRFETLFSIDRASILRSQDNQGNTLTLRGVTTDATGIIMRTASDSGMLSPPPLGLRTIGAADFIYEADILVTQRCVLFEIGGGTNVAWSSFFVEIGADRRVYVACSYANTKYDVGGFYGGTGGTGVGTIPFNRRTRIKLERTGQKLVCHVDGVETGTLLINGSLYNTLTRPLRVGHGQAANGSRYSVMNGTIYSMSFQKEKQT